MLSHHDIHIEDTALATIEAARELESALSSSTFDLGHDTDRTRAMLQAFAAGELYRQADEPTLDALRARVLGVLSDRVPGYRTIALTRNTDDFWFLDEELEAIRKLWEQLRLFRRLRQRVIDAVAAERQLSALRRRPAAMAAE